MLAPYTCIQEPMKPTLFGHFRQEVYVLVPYDIVQVADRENHMAICKRYTQQGKSYTMGC